MLRSSLLFGISILVVAAMSMPAAAQWTEQHKFWGSDTVAGDGFGNGAGSAGLQLVGDIALIGAAKASGHGEAYLIDVTTGTTLQKLNTTSLGLTGSYFGHGAGFDNNVAVVGAPYSGDSGGVAHVFDMTTGEPTFELTGDDVVADDNFGVTARVRGNTALVGSRNGTLYMFDVNTGLQTGKIVGPDGGAFSDSLDVDGNIALIGAPEAGAAYLYDITTGTQLSKLTGDGDGPGLWFGGSVSILGDLALVGEPAYASPGDKAAYLFDISDPENPAQLYKWDGVEDFYGYSVALGNGVAAVGAQGYSGASGAVYLYDTATGAQIDNPSDPSLPSLLASDAGGSWTAFGHSMAFSGQNLIITASGHDEMGQDSGAGYLFTIPEPSALLLLSMGAVGLLGFRWRRGRAG